MSAEPVSHRVTNALDVTCALGTPSHSTLQGRNFIAVDLIVARLNIEHEELAFVSSLDFIAELAFIDLFPASNDFFAGVACLGHLNQSPLQRADSSTSKWPIAIASSAHLPPRAYH